AGKSAVMAWDRWAFANESGQIEPDVSDRERRARCARIWRTRHRGRSQAAGEGASSSARVRLERLLYRRAHRLQLRPQRCRAVGSGADCRVRQFQWRDWWRAGRLPLAAFLGLAVRRRGRSSLPELSSLEFDHRPDLNAAPPLRPAMG